jgi:hypothetical protein
VSTAPEAHSKFSASAAVRWMACPGSTVLSEGKVDKPSKYAAEGTAAHQVAAWCLTENRDAVAYLERVIEADGFTFVVDEDMACHVQVYVDLVREYATGADVLMVERRVNYSGDLAVDPGDGFGTSDTIIAKGPLLVVADLKFGMGEEVEAEGNPQMQLYALGALAEFDGIAEFERVLMVISQPRISTKPKEWEIPVSELRAFAASARTAAERVFDARLEYPGVDWHERYTDASNTKACRWCKAKATCPTLRSAVTETVFAAAVPATPEEFEDATPALASPHAGNDGDYEHWLSACLSKVDQIEDWCKAVRAEAEARLATGQAVPGYKLVRGKRGARAWSNPAAAQDMLKTFRLKVEEMFDLRLISPTSAEKLAKAGTIGKRQWPKLQELIIQPEGGLHVAPDSDPREAVSIAPVETEFEDVAPAGGAVDDLA